MTPYPKLELINLYAGYGEVPIVHDFSTRLPPASITTLIGGNGAGKSTLLRAVFGTVRRFSGQIILNGEAIEHLSPAERLKRGIGFVPQGRCNFPRMTVAENIKMGCYTLPGRAHRAAIDRVTSQFPLLRSKWSEMAGNLSGGDPRRCRPRCSTSPGRSRRPASRCWLSSRTFMARYWSPTPRS